MWKSMGINVLLSLFRPAAHADRTAGNAGCLARWSDGDAWNGRDAAGTSEHAPDDAAALQMMSARCAGSVAGASRPAASAPATAAASCTSLLQDDGRSAGSRSAAAVEPAAATAFPRVRQEDDHAYSCKQQAARALSKQVVLKTPTKVSSFSMYNSF